MSWRTRSHNCGGERAKGEQKEERGLSNAMPPTTAPVWQQKVVRLSPRRRGCHLVTRDVADEIRPLLKNVNVGMLNLFVQHTSCSLTINENCDPSVRHDMETFLCGVVPDLAARPDHRDRQRQPLSSLGTTPVGGRAAVVAGGVAVCRRGWQRGWRRGWRLGYPLG